MENSDQIKFKCPYCATDIESQYHSIINVTQNPDLKRDLFDGKIFLRDCPSCKKQIQIIYDFIYHDMEEKLLFIFSSSDQDFKEIFADLIEDSKTENFDFRSFYAGYQVRIVHDINDLFEKIYIFNDQLDDRVIELCKYFVFRELHETDQQKDLQVISLKYLPADVFVKEYSASTEDLIGLNALTAERKAIIMPIKKDLYIKSEKYILEETQSSELEGNLIVDQNWLQRNLK